MKASGYDVTFDVFLAADANDMESMVKAAHTIRAAVVALHEAGFREIEARPKYRSRREVADDTQQGGGDSQAPGGAPRPDAAGEPPAPAPEPDPDAPLLGVPFPRKRAQG